MKERLKEHLIERYGYSVKEAECTAKDLSEMEFPDLKLALSQWLNTGRMMEVASGKYTASGLMGSYLLEYPAALVFIDWHRKAPAEAEKSLMWIRMEGL